MVLKPIGVIAMFSMAIISFLVFTNLPTFITSTEKSLFLMFPLFFSALGIILAFQSQDRNR